ncbi:MAG: hypothetical protein ACREMY_03555, partial [bacterium]
GTARRYLLPAAKPTGKPTVSASSPTRGLAAAAPAGPGATRGTGGGAPGTTGTGGITGTGGAAGTTGAAGSGPGNAIGTTGPARAVRPPLAGAQGASGPRKTATPAPQTGPPIGNGAAIVSELKSKAFPHKPMPVIAAMLNRLRVFNANSDD